MEDTHPISRAQRTESGLLILLKKSDGSLQFPTRQMPPSHAPLFDNEDHMGCTVAGILGREVFCTSVIFIEALVKKIQ